MGWLHTRGADKRAIIQDCIADRDSRQAHDTTLAHCLRGNVLWTVHERLDKPTGQRRRFIGCDLLACDRGFGWGYKPLDESMGPAAISCPLAYLRMTPTVNPAWRDRVHAYHDRQRRQFTVGDKVALVGATTPPWVVIRSLRPLTGAYNGCTYRLPGRCWPSCCIPPDPLPPRGHSAAFTGPGNDCPDRGGSFPGALAGERPCHRILPIRTM